MFRCRLRPSLRAIAFYAITYLFWVSFAYWAAPSIVARDKENLSIQNFVAAALLAVLLHVMIVLFIWRIDHKHIAIDFLKRAHSPRVVTVSLRDARCLFVWLTSRHGHPQY